MKITERALLWWGDSDNRTSLAGVVATVSILILVAMFLLQARDSTPVSWQGEWKCLELCQCAGCDWTGFCINPNQHPYVNEWINEEKATVKNNFTGEVLDVLDLNNCSERVWVERREDSEIVNGCQGVEPKKITVISHKVLEGINVVD